MDTFATAEEAALALRPDHPVYCFRPKVLREDFQNMPEVQRGLKSSGFSVARPNPRQEATVSHFHQVLADYMGRDAPVPITP